MKQLSLFAKEPILLPMLVLLAVIWLIPHTSLPGHVKERITEKYQRLPKVKVDFHPSNTLQNRYSNNKTALYLETSDDVKHVTPLLLHMTQIVPPEWRFLFIGSKEQISRVNSSRPAREMVELGKLRLQDSKRFTDQWPGKDLSRRELRNRLLTNTSFYDDMLPGVEWLFTFKSSSVLCANANETVNDYLNYTWVGAPWQRSEEEHFVGGNGGLAVRRVSAVREVLSFQARIEDGEDEDKWLSKRIGLLPGSNNANSDVEARFSVESLWQDKPMGYVVPVGDLRPGSGNEVWDDKQRRLEIYRHCPEIKMVLPMQLERLRCPESPPSNVFFDEVIDEEHNNDEQPTGKTDSTSESSLKKVNEDDEQANGKEGSEEHDAGDKMKTTGNDDGEETTSNTGKGRDEDDGDRKPSTQSSSKQGSDDHAPNDRSQDSSLSKSIHNTSGSSIPKQPPADSASENPQSQPDSTSPEDFDDPFNAAAHLQDSGSSDNTDENGKPVSSFSSSSSSHDTTSSDTNTDHHSTSDSDPDHQIKDDSIHRDAKSSSGPDLHPVTPDSTSEFETGLQDRPTTEEIFDDIMLEKAG